jgi:hypothetical protein
MAMDVTREEFDHLKARVDVVEVEGEKTVTRHILQQTRREELSGRAVKWPAARQREFL